MSRGVVWKISVATTAEAEDAVAELLDRIFGQPASTHHNFETGRTTVAVYCPVRPVSLPARSAALRAGLAHIRACGLNAGSGRTSVQPIPRENWAESWKRHFKPIAIGDALLLKPSWSRRRPRRGQAVVVLDPGLSFGTGQHPTTSYCLRELARHRVRGQSQAFLDIGTGSGILAIAAAKLGYTCVHAIDHDPEAVRIARANARANHVLLQVRITRQDLAKLPVRRAQRYDLICANLLSTLLLTERKRILNRLKPGGALVVAGLLKSEFHHIRISYEAAGMRLVFNRTEKEWQSGTFMSGKIAG
jgi:ribosomal protein L11 methyltransferase